MYMQKKDDEMKNREDIWRELWKRAKTKRLSMWDYPSEIVYSFLTEQVGEFDEKLCLEAGSGTGKVCLRLAQNGAKGILLDTSREALKLSKIYFNPTETVHYVVGSMLALPFKESSLDFVWNVGVLEHFTIKEQQSAISEGLRVLKNENKLTIIVPNKKASYVNFFRNLSIKTKTWLYGYEKPLAPEDFKRLSPKPVHLTSLGFLWQFRCVYLPVLQTVVSAIFHMARHVFPYLEKVDKNYPGYFLVATFIK